MWTKIIKKIVGAVLSLTLISILIFFLSKLVPGDPILAYLDLNNDSQYSLDFEKEYTRKALELGQDNPLFYFSILPRNFPRNLQETILLSQRKWERSLLFEGYDHEKIKEFWSEANEIAKETNDEQVKMLIRNDFLFVRKDWTSDLVSEYFDRNSSVNQEMEPLMVYWEDVLQSKKLNIWPRLHIHGFKNQYHSWVSNFIVGDLGTSVLDQKEVKLKIKSALTWTLFLVLFSLLLSYLIGIILGIVLASIKRVRLTNAIEKILFGLYSIPIFWLATVLLVFFTTAEYGRWTNIFPSVGLVPLDLGEAWYVRINNFGKQLILPVFCLVVHNLAFISSLTKRNLMKSQKMGHILTAKAYGYSEREILVKDVFPHTLLPLITSITASIPAAIGGSLVIEIIFNIPGMGRLLYNAILNYDWPVVFSVTMFIAFITILAYIIADVLYQFFDPRIKEE